MNLTQIEALIHSLKQTKGNEAALEFYTKKRAELIKVLTLKLTVNLDK